MRAITIVCCLAFAVPAAAQDAYDRTPAECAQMSTEGVEVVPYVVQQGDSCARIARRQYGDRSRYDLIHAYNPGMGPEPHRHVAGTHLCLPREAPARGTGPAARVTALRPDVRSRPPRVEDWQPAEVGEGIDRGTRLNTLQRAFAELTFVDTTIVTLRGDTLVVIYGESSGAVRRTASEAVLERGALRSRLGALRAGHRLQVRTPSSRVELEGGSAVATVDAEATTRVSNHEGGAARVADESGQRPVRVRAGMGSAVRRGAAPSPPQPLPDAPTWAASQPTRFVGVQTLTTARGRWAPVADARVYRVEIARRPDGRDLVAQLEVPAEVTAFEIHRLPPGNYYASVSTIDVDLFESRPSSAFAFEVTLGSLRAPGEQSAAAPELDFGDASEEVAPVVVVPGSRFEAPEGMRCGLTADSLARELTLLEPGETTLVCAAEQGEGAISAVPISVAQITLVAAGGEATPLLATRGEESDLELTLRSSAALPADFTLEGSEGVEVIGTERDGERLRARVRVAAGAPEPAQVTLVAPGGTPLGAAPLRLADAGEPAIAAPEPAEPEEETPARPLWGQTFGTTLLASAVGVRDVERDLVGAWLAMGYFNEPEAGGSERVRGTAGARAALLERRLHLELAATGDFIGEWDRQAQRGSGDLYGAVGVGALMEDDAAIVIEVGSFFPTQQGEGGLGVTRLTPSVHASVHLDEDLLLRTRQGAFVDLDDSENVAWVSAYALDYRVVELLTVGLELDFSLGQEDRELLLLPLVGGGISLSAGPLVIGLGARFGLSEEAWNTLGVFSAHATVELGVWNAFGG